jgi:hypothetical protein
MGHRLRAEGVDLDDPGNLQYYDRRTLLHWNHLRDGRAGNWRDLATSSQRAILARLCDSWLAAHGYETDTRNPGSEEGQTPSVPKLFKGLRTEMELARGWLACSLRCASLRHPQVARTVKRCLGITTDRVPARPIEATAPLRRRTDTGAAVGSSSPPHSSFQTQGASR